ncbi:MAG TPA: AMP-binding protein, partial [Candidatus Deferrimicrobium sp.]|nr:AMP-binding protein [Candidatus Deferrimicrobium sp.]
MKENNMKEQIDFQKKLMEDYWLKKIAGVEDFFNNPAEKNITGKYDSLGVEVEPSITARIKNIARHNEISECIILLSVYSILLYRYYQHPTMIILSPGMKANPDAGTGDNGISPLFYKLNIGAGDSIKQILQNTHREFHETMAYKDYDYNRLKSILERRNIEMAQVYQVGFFDNRVYIEYPAFEEPLLQLRIEGTTDQKLQVRLKYETDLFEEAFIYQFLTHYQNILYYLDKDLDVTVEKIEILSLGEKQALVFNFNAPSAVYPVDKTLVDLFEQQAEANPDRAAVYSEDIVLTYRHLDEKANRLANYLKETRQTTADDLIAFMLHRSEWLITAVFGVLKSGAGYLPLSPDYPGDHIRYVLNDARAKVVIAEDWNLIEKKGLTDCSPVSLQDDWPRISNYPNSSTRGGGKPGSLAYVIYTSGSTGKPKGVMVEHHNVVRLLFSDKFQFQFGPDDSWTLFHSPWFDFSVWEIFGSLLYGGRLVVLPEKIIQTPGALLSVVEKEQITVLNQIPFVFYNLIAEILKETGAEKRRLSLRYVIFGGDALNPQMLKRWAEQYPGVKLINMYGITETTVHVTYKEIGGREIAAGKSNIGKPIPTLSCYIIDRDMRLQPIGIMGEIVVGGDGVSRGYLNR